VKQNLLSQKIRKSHRVREVRQNDDDMKSLCGGNICGKDKF